MPGKTEFDLHPWDERVGQDASIVNVARGKRQINRDAKQISQIPLPLHQKGFMCDLPTRNYSTPNINTDALLWKSYRSIIKPASDVREQGKRVFWTKTPSNVHQANVRKGLRKFMKHATDSEERMKSEQHCREDHMKTRHVERYRMEVEATRERVKTKGFEGIRKPVMRNPPPDPAVSQEEVEKLMSQPCFRAGGKRMVTEHAASMDMGKPFGAQLRSESEPLRRWENKTFT